MSLCTMYTYVGKEKGERVSERHYNWKSNTYLFAFLTGHVFSKCFNDTHDFWHLSFYHTRVYISFVYVVLMKKWKWCQECG